MFCLSPASHGAPIHGGDRLPHRPGCSPTTCARKRGGEAPEPSLSRVVWVARARRRLSSQRSIASKNHMSCDHVVGLSAERRRYRPRPRARVKTNLRRQSGKRAGFAQLQSKGSNGHRRAKACRRRATEVTSRCRSSTSRRRALRRGVARAGEGLPAYE